MLKKVSFLGLALVVALAFGGTAAFADSGANGNDGRLNPAGSLYAVYYHHEDMLQQNDDGEWYMGDKVTGVEVWLADPTTYIGQLDFYAPVDINALQDASGTMVQIAAANGYSLSYLPQLESFYVTMPTGYSYVWEAWWAD